MSDLKQARTDPEALLWDQMEAVHAGMLGVEGSGQHMQPMAHQVDREGRRLWFLTKRGTDLHGVTGTDAPAHFCIISKAQDFHACLSGRLVEQTDRSRLEELWNPMVGAWFDGKDDPDVVILAFEPKHAAIWASTGSRLAFAWEVAKANMTDARPDVGVRTEVAFA